MALPDLFPLFDFYLKRFATVAAFALYFDPTAFRLAGIEYRHRIAAEWALHFLILHSSILRAI